MPSSAKQLSVALTLSPESLCLSSGNINFLTVSYYKFVRENTKPLFLCRIIPLNTPGARETVMSIAFNTADSTISFSYRDRNGNSALTNAYFAVYYFPPHYLKSRFKSNFLTSHFNLVIALDMKTGAFLAHGLIGNDHYSVTAGSLSYDDNWIFNGSTEITICSNADGLYSIQCTIEQLKIGYSLNSFSTADIVGKGIFLRFTNIIIVFSS